MSGRSGLDAALADAVAEAGLPGEPEQLELNEIAQLPLLGEVTREGRPVKPGRPPGSVNKATKELASYILSRHRHPVIAAAEVCDMPLADLAKALSCERLDAAKYQQSCREFVARYTLQAMPQSVQVDMGTVGMLYVISQNAPRPGETERSPFGLDMQVEKPNEINGGSVRLLESQSHGSAKPLTEQGNQ